MANEDQKKSDEELPPQSEATPVRSGETPEIVDPDFDDATESTPERQAEVLRGALGKLEKQEPQMASMMMSMIGAGTMGNPLQQKMDASHITQVLDLASKHDERTYELKKQAQQADQSDKEGNRKYIFWGLMVVVVLLAFVMFIFRDKPDILLPIISAIGGLFSGFLGGYGVGKKATGQQSS